MNKARETENWSKHQQEVFLSVRTMFVFFFSVNIRKVMLSFEKSSLAFNIGTLFSTLEYKKIWKKYKVLVFCSNSRRDTVGNELKIKKKKAYKFVFPHLIC